MKVIAKNDLMIIIPLIQDRNSFNLDDFKLILNRFGSDCFVVDGYLETADNNEEMKKLREEHEP